MAVYKKVPGHETVNISTLEFDTKPTKGSLNPVTSDGISTQSDNIAEAFSASSTYAIGEVVIGPDGKLYQCTTAVETAGEWDPEDWTQTAVAEVVGAISEAIPESASVENKLVTQDTLDEATEAWNEGYTPKGPASVSTLNGLSGQENGDRYVLTNGGTLSAGSVVVSAGDEVAWDSTGNKWYKVNQYGLKSVQDTLVKEVSAIIDHLSFESKRSSFVTGTGYALDVGVGNNVDLNGYSLEGFYSYKTACKKGDIFKVAGKGGSIPRLWGLTDSNGKLLSVATAGATQSSLLVLVAEQDGYLLYNTTGVAYRELLVAGNIEDLRSRVANLEVVSENRLIANIDVKLSAEDVSSRITSFTFANVDDNPIMSQVYAAFDGLVSDFPNLVSKQDAATVADLSYPDYADGVYNTYVYKISNSNTYAGNASVCKKKTLFLYAGTHGDEIAAMANCYVFASRLCNDLASDDNLFKLISAYDIYILPVLNGYGAIHNTRTNGNGVDINRNFPTNNWEESGSGTDRYTGPSAGSEFETKLIMALVQEYAADVIVDHHNYAGLARQFYVSVPNDRLRLVTYQMLAECSLVFKKAYPEYFGTNYSLLVDSGDSAPLNVGAYEGASTQWLADNGFSFGGVVEISDNINYLNGVSSTSTRDRWGASVFSVGEFTLRCALCHYCNEALK